MQGVIAEAGGSPEFGPEGARGVDGVEQLSLAVHGFARAFVGMRAERSKSIDETDSGGDGEPDEEEPEGQDGRENDPEQEQECAVDPHGPDEIAGGIASPDEIHGEG